MFACAANPASMPSKSPGETDCDSAMATTQMTAAPSSTGDVSKAPDGISEEALTATMEFLSAHELLQVAPRVSKTWRNVAASVYGWRAAEAVCFDDDEFDPEEFEGALAKRMEKPTKAMIEAA